MSAVAALFFTIAGSSEKAGAQFLEHSRQAASAQPNRVINEYNFFSNAIDTPQQVIPGLEGVAKGTERTHKSSFLAFMLSFTVPGLGEYYVGDQIWRGMIFTAIDIGLLYGNRVYNSKGNDANAAFQNYSDKYWSPQKYADYLDSLLLKSGHSAISNPNDFGQINKAEDTLNYFGFPDFTHNLPAKGSQQYYEIISKYIQYTLGWQDAVTENPTQSAEYQTAANMRADMNHQFEIRDDFLYGIFLNHILSAIDAALLARDHNTPIHLEGELKQSRYPDGTMGYVPTAKFRYTF